MVDLAHTKMAIILLPELEKEGMAYAFASKLLDIACGMLGYVQIHAVDFESTLELCYELEAYIEGEVKNDVLPIVFDKDELISFNVHHNMVHQVKETLLSVAPNEHILMARLLETCVNIVSFASGDSELDYDLIDDAIKRANVHFRLGKS